MSNNVKKKSKGTEQAKEGNRTSRIYYSLSLAGIKTIPLDAYTRRRKVEKVFTEGNPVILMTDHPQFDMIIYTPKKQCR